MTDEYIYIIHTGSNEQEIAHRSHNKSKRLFLICYGIGIARYRRVRACVSACTRKNAGAEARFDRAGM